jgi:hypothetical protein
MTPSNEAMIVDAAPFATPGMIVSRCLCPCSLSRHSHVDAHHMNMTWVGPQTFALTLPVCSRALVWLPSMFAL